MAYKHEHLLGLEELDAEEILTILDTAESFREISERPIKKVPLLRGQTVVNLFFEPSTRTRISFELAEKRLSADTVSFTAAASSTKKGETLKDTARNIESMKINLVVIRHQAAGAPHFLANCLDAKIINAGDGAHEHPTQGLLDLFTIRQKLGRIEGLNVLIIGDITHSRVARSDLWGLTKLGASVTFCGPPTLIPPGIEKMGAKVSYHLDEVLPQADVIYILRIQLERQRGGLFPSLREYTQEFGITSERLKSAKPEAIVMHPGPINRGLEVSALVADGPRSVILDQVTNGVAVRMAALYLLSGGEGKDVEIEA
ncbi:aspartate carbamoyltransferase catalytic subunit [candidate division KSB1 bacterium]